MKGRWRRGSGGGDKGGMEGGGGQNCLPPPEKTTIKRPSLIRVKIWLRRSYTNFSLL